MIDLGTSAMLLGRVVSVTIDDEMLADQTVVDVEVASSDAPALAARAATGRVALIVDGDG